MKTEDLTVERKSKGHLAHRQEEQGSKKMLPPRMTEGAEAATLGPRTSGFQE
jgi:hypothetical protein